MKKLTTYLLAATAALTSVPAFAQSANLVQNGTFSSASSNDKSATPSGNFQLGNYGTVSNWTSTGGYNLLYNTSNANLASGNAYGDFSATGAEYLRYAATGMSGNFLALDGDSSFAMPVFQTIAGLVSGQVYTLAFDWMADQIDSRNGAVTAGLDVAIDGQAFQTAALSASSGVQHASYTFTYNSGTPNSVANNVLGFLSYGSPTGQPPVALLDNVSITSAVPEPASWAMMIVGIGIVGGAMRLRRRKNVTSLASFV